MYFHCSLDILSNNITKWLSANNIENERLQTEDTNLSDMSTA